MSTPDFADFFNVQAISSPLDTPIDTSPKFSMNWDLDGLAISVWALLYLYNNEQKSNGKLFPFERDA